MEKEAVATPQAGTMRALRLPGWLKRLPLWLISLPALLFLVVPLLAVVVRVSLSDLLTRLANQEVAQAISLSLTTTAWAVALTLLFGTPLAYLLARRRFRGRVILDTLIDLVIVLPPSVAGIALLVAFGRRGLVGHWLSDQGITLAFTPAAVVLAQLFVASPFYIRTATTALADVRREVEEAAAIDGASARQIFQHVTLPLIFPSLFAGAVMTWARALGEFGATILFAGNFPGRTQTIPLAIYIGFEVDLQTALTLAVILLVLAFGVLLLTRAVLRRRIELSRSLL